MNDPINLRNHGFPWRMIALYGIAGAGKDTFHDLLRGWVPHANHVVRMAFADAVREEVADLHGLDYHLLTVDREYKEKHRQKLIDHGEAVRMSKPYYWIQKALSFPLHYAYKLQGDGTPSTIVVMTDMGFLNEFHVLKGLGAFTIRIHRPIPYNENSEREVQLTRAAQWGEIAFDLDIHNDGDLEHYHEVCHQTFEKLGIARD